MTNDNIFRLILLVCFAALLPFGLYYRIRSKTGEKLDRWQDGTFILFGLRLSGIPFLIGSLAWMINPQRMNTPATTNAINAAVRGSLESGCWDLSLAAAIVNRSEPCQCLLASSAVAPTKIAAYVWSDSSDHPCT